MRLILSVMSVLLVFISCNKGSDENKDLIKEFVNEVIIRQKNVSVYISLNDELDQNKKEILNELINSNIIHLKKTIKEKGSGYKILSDKEAKEKGIDPNFEYNDYSEVYHLVMQGSVITSFIIENGKIISFSYNLIKNKSRPRTPLILR